MGKIMKMFLSCLLAVAVCAGQVVENPAQPPGKKAGRVIRLKEVLRVRDGEGNFFFREPWEVLAAPNGHFYVLEPDKFYQFDPGSRFVRNLYRKGEGPGEFNQGLTEAIVGDGEIILASSNVLKIVRMDPRGGRREEVKPQGTPFTRLLGYFGGRYGVLTRERGSMDRAGGIHEDRLKLGFLDGGGLIAPTPAVFPMTYAMTVSNRSVSMANISRLLTAPRDARFVYLSTSPSYLVHLLDFEKGTVVQSLRRDYRRVKMATKRKTAMDMPEFANDITRLLVYKDLLWVVTSIFDKSKGILVDVFDRDGRYRDAFYLPLTGILTEDRWSYYAPLAVSGDFLYHIESGADGEMSVVKYLIIDS